MPAHDPLGASTIQRVENPDAVGEPRRRETPFV
jgi:hypothetical protein